MRQLKISILNIYITNVFKKKSVIITILIFACITVASLQYLRLTHKDSAMIFDNLPTRAVINGKSIDLLVAVTPEQQATGVSLMSSMPEDMGMLFPYSKYLKSGFHMKNCQFSIDIIWIKDLEVIGCEENLAYETPEDQKIVYYPPESINRTLEVVAGFCEKYGIEYGSQIQFIY